MLILKKINGYFLLSFLFIYYSRRRTALNFQILISRVKSGAYHTLVLEPNRQFTLGKTLWDPVALDRVEEACDVSARAEVYFIKKLNIFAFFSYL